MENTIYTVVGITKGTSKKSGKLYTVLHVTSDFDDYAKGKGATGVKAENIYIASDLRDVQLGDEVHLNYGKGFDGKAIVNGVEVLSE